MTKLDLQPTLVGSNISLRPLALDDFEDLYAAASNPEIWAQHPDSKRYKRDIFHERFFVGAIASLGAFAVLDNKTNIIIGSSRYYEYDPAKRELSIGYTFLAQEYWGGGANQEMKALMLEYAFNYVDAVWFHVGKDNIRSRKAVEKLGAELAYEKQRELDGKPFVQLYYKLCASSQD